MKDYRVCPSPYNGATGNFLGLEIENGSKAMPVNARSYAEIVKFSQKSAVAFCDEGHGKGPARKREAMEFKCIIEGFVY